MQASQILSELPELLPFLKPDERAQIDKLLTMGRVWMPLVGPQTEALNSKADILFYGGAAGGGKTDLICGAALTQHIRTIIFRREGTQLQGIYQRLDEILGSRDGFNSQDRVWRYDDKLLEFGSCPNLGDENRYQGRPHDLIAFDEITHFLEFQFRFLMGWNRTTTDGQRCRVICSGNPPTSGEGEWVIDYWAPWLKGDHPNPAKPGELRWFATVDGKDIEVEGAEPFEHNGELIKPLSRTFIPSRIGDNPFLVASGYMSTLQSLPEPLRSQMLHGDFHAGGEDDPWQVIPETWVRQAQERWSDNALKGEMSSLGVDPARGGADETVVAARYDNWYAPLIAKPGVETPDGPSVAAIAIGAARNDAPIHVDSIGVGGSVVDHLKGTNVVPVDWRKGTEEKDKATGKLRFKNQRSLHWWRMREALDPDSGRDIQLPPDDKLRRDLCAPHFSVAGGKDGAVIVIEQKEVTQKRIGRSPDRGDAVVMANLDSQKRARKRKPIQYDNRGIV